VVSEAPRHIALRDMLNHLAHHRATTERRIYDSWRAKVPAGVRAVSRRPAIRVAARQFVADAAHYQNTLELRLPIRSSTTYASKLVRASLNRSSAEPGAYSVVGTLRAVTTQQEDRGHESVCGIWAGGLVCVLAVASTAAAQQNASISGIVTRHDRAECCGSDRRSQRARC
jgi:hypothetical protein